MGRKLNHVFLLECETKTSKLETAISFILESKKKRKAFKKKKNASKKRTEKGA